MSRRSPLPHFILTLPLALACATADLSSDASPDRSDARPLIDGGGGVDAPPGTPDSGPGRPDAADDPDGAPAIDADISGSHTLIISEVVDATLSGGLPKFVELTNTGNDPVDLSGYTIGHYNNGYNTLYNETPQYPSSVVMSGILAAGESYVISFEDSAAAGASTFYTVYDFDADVLAHGTHINGDDAIVLFVADGSGPGGVATGNGFDATVVDIFGVIGQDGTNTDWDYTDGYAERRPAYTSPSATFNLTDWAFSGADALDGMDGPGIAAVTSPGTH